jgi:hypothetical protein
MYRQLTLSAALATLPLWAGLAHADEAGDLYKQMKAGQCEPALASLVAGANAGDAAKQNWLGVALDFGTCAAKDTLRAYLFRYPLTTKNL